MGRRKVAQVGETLVPEPSKTARAERFAQLMHLSDDRRIFLGKQIGLNVETMSQSQGIQAILEWERQHGGYRTGGAK